LFSSANKWFSRRVWLAFALAIAVICVDQLTKSIALQNLQRFQRVPVLGDILGWYLTFNDSAAFSIGFGATWLFTIISAAAVLVLIWFTPRMQSIGWASATGLLLGGVTGNLIDRVSKAPGFPNGQVVDFIQIPFNFPIFNIADIFICSVMVFTVIRVFMGDKIGQPRSKKSTRS